MTGLKIEQSSFNNAVMRLNDADGIANTVDPDQTAQEQSDLGLHRLPSVSVPVIR